MLFRDGGWCAAHVRKSDRRQERDSAHLYISDECCLVPHLLSEGMAFPSIHAVSS